MNCAFAADCFFKRKDDKKAFKTPVFSTQVPQNVPVQFVPVNVPTPPPQVHNWQWQYKPTSENYDIA
jgi:hypothetical protein